MMSSGLLSLETERGKEIWKITQPPLTRISPELAGDLYRKLVAACKQQETEKEQQQQQQGSGSELTENKLLNDAQQLPTTDISLPPPPQTNEMK